MRKLKNREFSNFLEVTTGWENHNLVPDILVPELVISMKENMYESSLTFVKGYANVKYYYFKNILKERCFPHLHYVARGKKAKRSKKKQPA